MPGTPEDFDWRRALAEIARALRDGVAANSYDHLPPRLRGPLADAAKLSRRGQGLAIATGFRLGVAVCTPDDVPLPPRAAGHLDTPEDDPNGPRAA